MSSTRRFLTRLRAFVAKPLIVTQAKPVLLDDSQRCENPIFLIGVHRSGTSLTRRMFNCHNAIACPPESFYIEHYCAMLDDEMTVAGYQGFGLSPEEMRQALARQAGELHEAFRQIQGKRRWADKTPQYTACLPGLARLFGPGAQFVLIFRDPRDIAHSIHERGWRFLPDEGDLIDDTVHYVETAIRAMLEFEASHPGRSTRLVYERLVAEPEAELTRTLAFLGEAFDPAMLSFNEGQHNFGTEDPMVRGSSTLRPSTGNWRNLPPEARGRLTAGLAAIAAELGYDPA